MKTRFNVQDRDWPIPGVLCIAGLLMALLWVSPAMGQDMIRLDNHTKTYPENEVIPDWDDKKISPLFGGGDKFYFRFVHKSDQEHYLHLASGDNNSFSVGSTKEFEVPE